MTLSQQHYQASKAEQWQGRSDGLPGERIFQCVECIDLQQQPLPKPSDNSYTLLGFCCDAGVERNLGRTGAAQGPQAIRHALTNLALPQAHAYKIYDVGNILCPDDDLECAQQQLAQVISEVLSQQHRLVVLGGGHEIAWGHYQGIRQAHSDLKLGIINFDAHFDLRPLPQSNHGTSGTPFLQMAKHSQQHKLDFNYLCLGIQPTANTASLWQTANDLHANIITADVIQNGEKAAIHQQIAHFIDQQDALYVTLCLDVFASSIAPGVSAPQALGLFPWHVKPLLQQMIDSKKIISFDIAELSPPHDTQQRTAQLAASLLASYLSA